MIIQILSPLSWTICLCGSWKGDREKETTEKM